MSKQTDNQKGCSLADRLYQGVSISDEELRWMLQTIIESKEELPEWVNYLTQLSGKVAQLHFGKSVYLRGLIEVSNYCKNNCYYCGIRAANKSLERYRLTTEEVLSCCRVGYELGLRTFVLQGGEDPRQDDAWIESTIRAIRREFSSDMAAITLSLGERSHEAYTSFFAAGANRYLLRHETRNATHYGRLHPDSMSLENRLTCLNTLKKIGFQTGTGMMIGSPYQTVTEIIEDIRYIQTLQPEMIGIGPFVPQKDTPFAHFGAGSVTLTIGLIAILRLICPKALIPATTALATLSPQGRLQGILAGANVIMPNLSPKKARERYRIYDNKASSGLEAAENIRNITLALRTIDREIEFVRGDSPKSGFNQH